MEIETWQWWAGYVVLTYVIMFVMCYRDNSISSTASMWCWLSSPVSVPLLLFVVLLAEIDVFCKTGFSKFARWMFPKRTSP